MYINDARTFSISGSIGVDRGTYPVYGLDGDPDFHGEVLDMFWEGLEFELPRCRAKPGRA